MLTKNKEEERVRDLWVPVVAGIAVFGSRKALALDSLRLCSGCKPKKEKRVARIFCMLQAFTVQISKP